MRPFTFTLTLLLFANIYINAQDEIKIMHYNLLNYGNYTSYCTIDNNSVDNKDVYLKTIINYVMPDIFTVNELDDLTYYHQRILDDVLNTNGRNYYQKANSINYANSYLTNMLYYDSRKFVLHSQDVANTTLRDIQVYKLYYKDPDLPVHQDTAFLYCFVAHLKAGSDWDDEQLRAEMTENVMDYLDNINMAGNYIFMGDLNVQSDDEEAMQNLLYHPNTTIRFYDPEDAMGYWHNNSYFAEYHTQSTHTSSNGCAAYGGMDDRFDFILLSEDILNGNEHYQYLPDSYTALGQDGNRFNGSIIEPANTAVPYNIANALYDMSDHLPIIVDIQVDQEGAGILAYSNNKSCFQVLNPVKNKLKIQLSTKEKTCFTFHLQTIFGQEILRWEAELNPGLNNILKDIPKIKKGIYILTAHKQGEIVGSSKIIKQ